MRAAGKLKDAIAEMNSCTACPALADVCDQTRASMQGALPTLRARARTCDGTTLDAVVTIDGDVATSAVTLDPGRHDVRAAIGGRAEEQTVFVAESEHKNVSLVIGDPPRPAPLGVWVLGGTAAGALTVAGALFSVAASLPDPAPFVSPVAIANGEHAIIVDETKRDFAVGAGVALAVSVTMIVTALVVYLTRPFPHPKSPD